MGQLHGRKPGLAAVKKWVGRVTMHMAYRRVLAAGTPGSGLAKPPRPTVGQVATDRYGLHPLAPSIRPGLAARETVTFE